MQYIWQKKNWTTFLYKTEPFIPQLNLIYEKIGVLKGVMNPLSAEEIQKILVDLWSLEALKTSAMEGAFFSRVDLISSIKRNLNKNEMPLPIRDKNANGIAELISQSRLNYAEPLSQSILFEWHQMLFPKASHLMVGHWRNGLAPMQIISGSIGKEKVHFEAPPSHEIPKLMDQFISWFNQSGQPGKNFIPHAPIRSALVHLYFETIHPFEDGNGRIGRVLSEKVLSQGFNQALTIGLSATIESAKEKYYYSLKRAQHGGDVNEWIQCFIELILEAIENTESLLQFTLKKSKFFEQYNDLLNQRQLKVIQKMLEKGPQGFEGGMTAKKYSSISKCSKATATRDLQELKKLNIFLSHNAGRSVNYSLNL